MLPHDWQKLIKLAYPKRRGQGWKIAFEKIEKHVEDGHTFEDILKGADNYRRYCAENEIEAKYIKMASTFFGPGEWFYEYDDLDESNELTLDDMASSLGLTRQEGETDDHLKMRIGHAQTMKAYYGK